MVSLGTTISLTDPRAALGQLEREALARDLGSLTSLEAVVRWGYSQTPIHDVADVVVQDEYTHDVIMRLRGEVHLVFDTT